MRLKSDNLSMSMNEGFLVWWMWLCWRGKVLCIHCCNTMFRANSELQLKATFALMQRPWKQNERPILKINPKHPFQVFPIVISDRRKLDLCDFVGYLGHMGNNSGASVVVAFCSTTSSSSNKRQCMANNQDKPQISLPILSYSHIRQEDAWLVWLCWLLGSHGH